MQRIISELPPRHRYLLLILADFGIAVCSAKLIIHVISFIGTRSS
jgi:hypothetical protein